MTNSKPLPWYKDGLSFKCTQCGKCCTGAPGFVWISEAEMRHMAHFLNLSLSVFKRLYVKRRDNRYLLVEKKSENHNCIFYKDQKCQVYAARPIQCRTYPFWPENLNSEESWLLAAQECEGIQLDAPLVSFEEIQKTLEDQESSH